MLELTYQAHCYRAHQLFHRSDYRLPHLTIL